MEFSNCCPSYVLAHLKCKKKEFTDRCRAAATSKMELLVTTVNGRKPLQTIVSKSSILDVAVAQDPDLRSINLFQPSVALLYPLKTSENH